LYFWLGFDYGYCRWAWRYSRESLPNRYSML